MDSQANTDSPPTAAAPVATGHSASRHEVTYLPNQRARMSLAGCLVAITKDCIRSRDLIIQLFRRDYMMMYKKSFLGMGWHIAAPIMAVLSWVLMNSTGVLDPGDVGIPYPAYVLISTSIWSLFMTSFTNMSRVLEVAQGFIHQVGFPRHALIVKQWLETFAGYMLAMAVMVVGVIIVGVTPSAGAFLFPIVLIPLVLVGSTIGLLVAVVRVVSPDVQKATTFMMGFWMYITPVIFSNRVDSPLLQTAIRWNPVTHLLVGARDIFITGTMSEPWMYAGVSVGSVFVFLIVLRLFYVTEQKVIEKMI